MWPSLRVPACGGLYLGRFGFRAAIVCGVSGAGSDFRVGGAPRGAGEGLIAIFRDVFASTSKIFILTGRLVTFLSRSATREAARIYHVYK